MNRGIPVHPHHAEPQRPVDGVADFHQPGVGTMEPRRRGQRKETAVNPERPDPDRSVKRRRKHSARNRHPDPMHRLKTGETEAAPPRCSDITVFRDRDSGNFLIFNPNLRAACGFHINFGMPDQLTVKPQKKMRRRTRENSQSAVFLLMQRNAAVDLLHALRKGDGEFTRQDRFPG
ncbi:hypothetical protein SDC9_178248 [bioreactor metagenome]|uniref:Uncharacterized protein n=1 Tax=bioreactor metagenome TaxID=1076179 RepID=A0A645GVK6_9ZZZZ